MYHTIFHVRPCRLSLTITVLLCALACTAPTAAQGTSGTLPDPITTAELMRYADRLGLSEDQRRAAERRHDDYREQFRTLRDNEINQFLQGMRTMHARMPDRAQMQSFSQQWERLSRRIATLDEQLFSSIQEILTPEQMALLPRVRLERERARYRGQTQMMMPLGGQLVDLSRLSQDVDLAPAERQAIDPALAAYEHRLTNAYKALFEASRRMQWDMFDAFEEAGFTSEDDFTDPETMTKMMEAMQDIMRDMFAGIMERTKELNDLNRRTFQSIRPLLSESSGRALRNAFYSRMFQGVDFALRLPVQPRITAAISHEEISDSLRESLQALDTETRRRLDHILYEAIANQEKLMEDFSPFDMDMSAWEEHNKKTMELSQKARELDQETQKTLTDMLATELDAAAQQQIATATADDAPQRPRAFAPPVPAAPDSEDAGPQRSHYDQHLPRAISVSELATYRRMLGLGEDQRAALEELHAEYLERFREMEEASLRPLQQAVMEQWTVDESGMGVPNLEAFDRISTLRRNALNATVSVDDSFFDQIAATLLDDDDFPQLERVRMARERETYRTGHGSMAFAFGMGMGSNEISRLDLARIVRRERLPDDQLARIDGVLAAYESELTGVMKEQWEAGMVLEELSQRWSAEMAQRSRDGEMNPMEQGMEYMQRLAEPQARVREISRRIATLNKETIGQLVDLLDDEHGRKVLHAYHRQAFPSVFNDPSAVESYLTSAMRLPDLTEEQRSRLADVVAEYRAAYHAHTHQMIAIMAESEPAGPGMDFSAEDWQAHMDRMEKLQKVQFERNELNTRAVGQLRSLLNEEQLANVGPLPEPVERTTGPWGF